MVWHIIFLSGGVKSRGKRSLSSGVAGLLDIIKKKKGEQDECWEVGGLCKGDYVRVRSCGV